MRSMVVVAALDWKRTSVAVWSSSKICKFSGSGKVVKFVLQGLSKHGGRINNTISAAKESIFNVVLAFYIKNSKKTIPAVGSQS